MGTRIKTFDSSGIAPGGRLFAADLNGIQDQYADIVNYAQTLGAGTYAIGDSGLQLVKYGTGEVRLTSKFRTDGTIMAFNDISARLSGDTNPRVIADTALNGIQFGPGNLAPDVNLYRFAANALKTDDSFEAVGTIKQNGTNVMLTGAAAGGALTGTYPNPSFAVDMATQAELDAHKASADHDGRYQTDAEIAASYQKEGQRWCELGKASQTVASSTTSPITFDVEIWDGWGMHSLVSNTERITFNEDGVYLVAAWATFATDADGYRKLSFSGTAVPLEWVMQTNQANLSSPTVVALSAFRLVSSGNYIQLNAFHNAGNNLAVTDIVMQVIRLSAFN